jgi:hypothetical protein
MYSICNEQNNTESRMMEAQYTAKLFYNNEALDSQSSDDFQRLMITLLNQIECSNTSTQGVIINNLSGQVIHRCRKTCID